MLISKEKIETKLENIIHLPLLQLANYANFTQRAKDLLNQLNEKEFRITVVGEFSAGKSTFLNALIGKDILPHSVNETTATVTYIKNVRATDSLCNKVKIEFFGNKMPIITELPKDANGLTEYVTTMAKDINVVEEVASVTIHVNFPYTDEPIVFVDTPGLNGVAKGHYERTRYEIQRAHTSIYLLHTRGLSQSNVAMYELLKQYQSSFVFVINAIDTLKQSEGETIELKVKELKEQLATIGVENNPTIMGVSALLALTAKDEAIQQLFEGDIEPLTAERREQLLQRSNFSQIENEIWHRLATSDKEKLKHENIEKKFESLVKEIIVEFEEQVTIHQVTIDDKQLSEINLRLNQAQQSKEDNLKSLQNFTTAKKSDIRSMLIGQVKQDLQKTQVIVEDIVTTEITKLMRSNEDPEILLKGLQNQVTHFMRLKEQDLTKGYGDSLIQLLSDLYESAVLRIEKHYPKIAISKQGINFSVKLGKANLEDLSLVQKITEKNHQVTQASKEQEQAMKMYKESQRHLRDDKDHVDSLQGQKQQVMSAQQRQLKSLGNRPTPVQKTESYTVEKSGLWSSVKSFFGGSPSYETRTRTVTDTSARERWDTQEARIKRDFSNQEKSITASLNAVQERLKRSQSTVLQNESRVESYEQKVKSLMRDLEILQKEKQAIYDKNKRLYYEKQRKDLLDAVADYLAGDLTSFYRKEIDGILLQELQQIDQAIGKHYEQSYNEYTKKLTKLKQQVMKEAVPQEREQAEKELAIVKKALA
ncbi:dynamin family protein [Solibacillus sp. FSL H8-0538]|uniref:dynamin family protein n=1 Tax=Solibacillus sp. FSL H8-0538 TaxID=2921400 RepID=UPI0030F52F24